MHDVVLTSMDPSLRERRKQARRAQKLPCKSRYCPRNGVALDEKVTTLRQDALNNSGTRPTNLRSTKRSGLSKQLRKLKKRV